MDLVKDFNLPGYVKGLTFAEASKKINNKFKDRNDKLSLETKNELLGRLQEAQEHFKQMTEQSQENVQPQEDIGQPQDIKYEEGSALLKDEGLTEEKVTNILGAANTGLEIGNYAFGNTGIDTTSDQYQETPKTGMATAGMALKGAAAGTKLLPGIGTAIGGAVGLIGGIIGGNKRKKEVNIANTNLTMRNFNKDSFGLAFGGNLPGGDPTEEDKKKQQDKLQQIKNQTGIPFSDVESARTIFQIPDYMPPKTLDFGKYSKAFSANKYTGAMGTTNANKLNVNVNDYRYINNDNVYNEIRKLNPGLNLNFSRNYGEGGPFQKKEDYNYYSQFPSGIPTYLSNKTESLFPGIPKTISITTVGNRPSQKEKKFFDAPTLETEQYPITTTARSAGVKSMKILPNPNLNTERVPDPIVKDSSVFRKMGDSIKEGAEDTSKFIKKNGNDILRYSPALMNAIQLAKLKKPGFEKLNRLEDKYVPSLQDEKQHQNIINAEYNSTGENIANATNGSVGAYRSNMLKAGLNKAQGLSNAYATMKAQNDAEMKIKQQFDSSINQINLQQANKENEINAQNKGNYDTQKSKLLGQIGNDLGNIGLEGIRKKYPLQMGMLYDSAGNYYKVDEKTGKIIKVDIKGNPIE